jgi:carboxymethylenebutenolidase
MPVDKITEEKVNFPGKACELAAWVVRPQTPGPHPVLLVIQEWWGLNEHIKDIAGRLAREGYMAVAPDLYSRHGHKVTTDQGQAAKLMTGLKKEDGVADLLSTLDWVKSQKTARADRIGIIGFCMGGSYALLLPCATKEIKASVPFYGEIPSEAQLEKLSCPVLYIWGEKDPWITRPEVDRLAAALKRFKLPGEIKIYPECGHAFFNDTRSDVYNPQAAADAWSRTLKFFAERLRT